jgi:hypothetical protein
VLVFPRPFIEFEELVLLLPDVPLVVVVLFVAVGNAVPIEAILISLIQASSRNFLLRPRAVGFVVDFVCYVSSAVRRSRDCGPMNPVASSHPNW